MLLIIVQLVTGLFLTIYYIPGTEAAYNSIRYLEGNIAFGALIRGLHYWSANILMIVIVLHLLRVVFWGAYKQPRDLTWVIGVILLFLVLGLGFTGYLLPWDQAAYWATVVGTEIMGTVPLVGGFIKRVAVGGDFLGPLTLIRFYSAHVLWLPALLVMLTLVHIGLVIKQGIAPPPFGRWANHPNKGDPFYPQIIFKDVLASLLIFILVLALALFHGATLEEPANPLTVDVVPRPEWYFMFLYKMLWYFGGPLEVVGTFVIPVVAAAIIMGLPWLDRSLHREPWRRPLVSISTIASLMIVIYLTVLGMTAPGPVKPGDGITPDPDLSPQARAGMQVYNEYGCASCHLIKGTGSAAGTDLSRIGSKRDRDWLRKIISDPRQINPAIAMPAYGNRLSQEEMENILGYLSSLK